MEESPAARLQGIILRAYELTGKPIAVLIDEYDAPLLDSNSDIPLQQKLRNEMRKFFSPLKGLGQYLRFLFITGISKFSQMSIFSELNNIQDISMRDDFSTLCGITEEELLTQLKPDINLMADANSETYEEACNHLKQQYDPFWCSIKAVISLLKDTPRSFVYIGSPTLIKRYAKDLSSLCSRLMYTFRDKTTRSMSFPSYATCAKEISKAVWNAPAPSSFPFPMIWRTRRRSIIRLFSTCFSA